MGSYFPDEWVQEVKSRTDIIEVVSEYVKLKKSGRGYTGLCPFHNEKTPSFHVLSDEQYYHCFGCGAGGDVFSFLMNIEGYDFKEVLIYLAERLGMQVPSSKMSASERQNLKNTDIIYDINKAAALFYYKFLLAQKGKRALEYLQERGLDKKTIVSFGLGYAPNGGEIYNYLIKKGFKHNSIIKSGLVVQKNNRVYDRFFNRVMFPIVDTRGRVAGFGGRVLDDSQPKYLNSSENEVFKKNSILYGLNIAKKNRPLNNIIVVEGYMDVISLHQFGYKNTVASLGTSLTEQQARLIRRYTRDVFIAYDGDSAGQKAALRGLDILNSAGCNVKVLKFDNNLDPDETLRSNGREGFEKIIKNSLSLIDYKLDMLRKTYNLNDDSARIEYASRAAKILTDVTNLIKRDMHIQRLKQMTGFDINILYREIQRLEGKSDADYGRVKSHFNGNNRHKEISSFNVKKDALWKAECYLASLVSKTTTDAKKILANISNKAFSDKTCRQIVVIAERLIEEGSEINPSDILSKTDRTNEVVKKMVDIFDIKIEYDNKDKFIDDCINELIYNRSEKQRLNTINEKLKQMDQSGTYDPDKYRALLEEVAALTRKIKLGGQGKEETL